MLRLLLYFLGVLAAAFGLSWLADRPGMLVVNWQGYEIETSVFRAIVILGVVIGLAVVLWSILRQLFTSPAVVGHYFRRRRQRRGLEALSSGLIAVGSGDRQLATRYALQARKSLPNEPLTHLLRAQTAQLLGDRATARRIYEAMRSNPETELLGLRGLYLEARELGESEAARQLAERAVAINPKLGWSAESLFAMQCKDADWASALETLATMKKHGQLERKVADRRRAVLLTAQAVEAEDADMARALSLSLEAHGLAPDLVPAAAIAGRLLASQGATPRSAKVLSRTWRRSPHPELATAYAYARVGDSPRDRLARVKELAHMTPHSKEGPIAVAHAAIEAQAWEEARRALIPLLDKPSQRVCTLMARIEGGQHGDSGRMREWLARAVHAQRDPAWVADGHASSKWAPASPVTGVLDAYRWIDPPESLEPKESDLLLEQLLPMLAPDRTVVAAPKTIAAEPVTIEAAAARPAGPVETPPSPLSSGAPDQHAPARPGVAVHSGANGSAASPPPKQPDGFARPSPSTTGRAASTAPTAKPDAAPTGNGQARPKEHPAGLSRPAPAVEAASPASAISTKPAEQGKGGTIHAQKPASSPQGDAAATTATGVKPARPPAKPASTRPKPEARVFVPPHAPDDPGPEPVEGEESRAPITRFRVPPAKDQA